MIGSEAERQFYLAAAGIRMWYARDRLPGAAPSPEYDFGPGEGSPWEPEPDSLPVPRKPAPESADRGRARIAQLQDLMGGKVQASPVAAPEPAPHTESPVSAPELPAVEPDRRVSMAETAEVVPRLCVAAWKGRRISLLCHLAEDASFSLQDNLARNILRSVGEIDASMVGPFRWPVFNNLKVTLNSLDDLMTALAVCFEDVSKTDYVITLGFSDEQLSQVFERGLGRTPDVAFPGTLASLASDPASKRSLWNAIRGMSAGL